MNANHIKPTLAIIPGDPAGVGPELVAKLLAEPEVRQDATVLLIGDEHIFEQGDEQAGLSTKRHPVDLEKPGSIDTLSDDVAWLPMKTIAPSEVNLATVTGAGGRSVLKTLDKALELAASKLIDGFMFAPFNKASLHLAGMGHSDELHYMAAKLKVTSYISEINVIQNCWTSRVTSHIPLADVATTIRQYPERIEKAVEMLHLALEQSGIQKPKIAVAALNPHAGDNGNFGREEIEIITPAIRRVQASGFNVTGPYPSDTVFIKAVAGAFDAVVTMYHDQGQIAIKLLGFDNGVTVQGGLPIAVTTPAHGTAFDIAGKGIAKPAAMKDAFDLLLRMTTSWTKP